MGSTVGIKVNTSYLKGSDHPLSYGAVRDAVTETGQYSLPHARMNKAVKSRRPEAGQEGEITVIDAANRIFANHAQRLRKEFPDFKIVTRRADTVVDANGRNRRAFTVTSYKR